MGNEYRVNGRRVRLKVNRHLVALRFDDALTRRGRKAAIEGQQLGSWDERLEVPNEKCTLLPVRSRRAATRTGKAHDRLIQHLHSVAGVVRAHAVFDVANGHAIVTERIAIGLRAGAKPPAIIRERGWKILERSADGVLVQLAPGERPFDVCAELQHRPGIEYAEPDFALMLGNAGLLAPHVMPVPRAGRGAPPREYSIRLTEADHAWQLVQGDAKVRIAILDGGLHPMHPDLAPVVFAAWNATTASNVIHPVAWDWHGTGCAAIAAGASVGAAGVKGVGHGCSLMLVKLGHSTQVNQPWTTRTSWERRAIDWAWQHHAHVLNLSWGSISPPVASVAAALDRALTKGRRGKGCVIVVAAGDGDGPVQFPGTHPGVITVSATNQFDEAKTPRSRDGEKIWGSSYGPEVSIAAPGVGLYTACANFERAGLHTFGFSGSSGSAPLVAGAAGLILSIRPELSHAEVRKILVSTADKVGGRPYKRGHNDRLGHGRLNVARAVKRALRGRKKR